eukprot:c3476_g1_i2.p1 GENE.c3476_g1_i2~~c3476_g1_i2.p1  ORF type:complete len:264 (-),score=48.65 c3476_g1_i2:8-799(-)
MVTCGSSKLCGVDDFDFEAKEYSVLCQETNDNDTIDTAVVKNTRPVIKLCANVVSSLPNNTANTNSTFTTPNFHNKQLLQCKINQLKRSTRYSVKVVAEYVWSTAKPSRTRNIVSVDSVFTTATTMDFFTMKPTAARIDPAHFYTTRNGTARTHKTRSIIQLGGTDIFGTNTELDLSDRELMTLENVKAMAKALKQNHILTKLLLKGHNIDFNGATAIAEALTQNSTLTFLSLKGVLTAPPTCYNCYYYYRYYHYNYSYNLAM